MKNLKKIVFTLCFVAVMCASCSDDDENSVPEAKEYPATLAYTGRMEIVDFKMYVGSPEGGKEISATYGDPVKKWGDRMVKYNHPDKITFISKDSILNDPYSVEVDKYQYKWEKDSLYGFNPNNDTWYFYGIGNKKKLEYRMGFYSTLIVDEGITIGGIGQWHGVYDEDSFFHENSFASPAEMMNEKDTITWCNVRYVYEKAENNK
jgi:hypothetical protein